jgi:hypothetical protein
MAARILAVGTAASQCIQAVDLNSASGSNAYCQGLLWP